ncbi:paralemmin 1a [Kryptolebias marmoratus]|uniref:paralemmin 1a n=1 Tax=Kryptolebias marmoratus TaxID=37003 RepID=UPI0018ACD42E|nr:paralemmin 1a [Kryptolebias marmoratus]
METRRCSSAYLVHEMNGEDGVHLLSSSEVDELIHKADEVSMMSQTVATMSSLSRDEVPEVPGPPQVATLGPAPVPCVAPQITGLEAKASGEPSQGEVSAENPVTMVFMGYQDVEDEDETKKLLGLQGTVKAELVLIDDVDRRVDPSPPAFVAPPTSVKPPETMEASDREMAGEVKKKKQPCKCCSIM